MFSRCSPETWRGYSNLCWFNRLYLDAFGLRDNNRWPKYLLFTTPIFVIGPHSCFTIWHTCLIDRQKQSRYQIISDSFWCFSPYFWFIIIWCLFEEKKKEICRRGPILVILSLIVLNNLLIYTHKVIIKVCIICSNSFRFISNPDNFSSIVPL